MPTVPIAKLASFMEALANDVPLDEFVERAYVDPELLRRYLRTAADRLWKRLRGESARR